MVPHDQQVDVTSPGMISEELDLDSLFAIDTLTTDAHSSRRPITFVPDGISVAPWWTRTPSGQACPLHNNQAENELPHPHDFVEFGFTKTKPCCISVS
jgi:hypothetical protein